MPHEIVAKMPGDLVGPDKALYLAALKNTIPMVTIGTLGAIVANIMFSLSAVSISTHHRASPAHFLSEIIATAGLIIVIFALARRPRATRIRPRIVIPQAEA